MLVFGLNLIDVLCRYIGHLVTQLRRFCEEWSANQKELQAENYERHYTEKARRYEASCEWGTRVYYLIKGGSAATQCGCCESLNDLLDEMMMAMDTNEDDVSERWEMMEKFVVPLLKAVGLPEKGWGLQT